ncbi:MAG TPA: D-aminoacylase [Rhizomicrobium sp.]|nr:D-aminoacylase [Rhizomicrobium sp.]
MPVDCLIREARVVDGTGGPWFVSDVLLRDGRIADLGRNLQAEGAHIVDAQGRYLAPGFIDAHCHDDLICLREPERIEKIAQGVTTLVVGNCSFSLYPATLASAPSLRKHFSTLLGEVLPEEVFDDLAGYRDAIHRRGLALNVVSLVGHAALRIAVIGHDRRSATEAECAAMQALLDKDLRAGAAGLSLGLVYPPSAYADRQELLALARTVQRHGKVLAAHIRGYEGDLLDAMGEFIDLLRASGAPGLLSHLQLAGRPNWGRMGDALNKLEQARGQGVDVSFDMYPYPAGSSYILQLLPPDALEGGFDVLLARLSQPEFRERLRLYLEGKDISGAPPSKVSLIGWDNVRISGVSNSGLKSLEGLNMVQASAGLAITPFELLIRLIQEDQGQTSIVMFQLDEKDLQAACTHRLHMVGSDGLPRPGTKPHPRAYGTFPRVAGRLRREGWFALEDAVCRMTSRAAERFGLADRGLIRPGMVADLVLFDDTIDDNATFDSPTRLPTGIEHVLVAGQMVMENGKMTGRLPGRVLGS